MNKAAFFVDGNLEKKFIQRACPNTVVRILNCNGKDVEMSAIAKRVATHREGRVKLDRCISEKIAL